MKQETKKILETIPQIVIEDDCLNAPIEYVFVKKGEHKAQLDGEFTPEQLEAIAQWMRHNLE